ncbi:head GIN domain-containing protein [uncultured Flavobacterium sp.]|uniref:head GIN domain-containing protein n=1 Tax=uncultured Flavobacterium sp. TaxID=165435 RepID=UPI0025DAE58F|nr:head GIN domain-containing protein [uncultured Flavobacterium sp.]
MKKAAMFLAGAFFALTAAAQEKTERIQGNGENTKEKREVSAGFDQVKVTGNFNVVLVSGQTGTITLEGEENLISQITTDVSEGELAISSGNKLLISSRNKKITVKVPVDDISRITLKGSGCIDVRPTMHADVELTLDGCGQIKAYVAAAKVKACVLGNGEISISGKAADFECRVVGSGSVKAYGVESPLVNALVSGSGNVEANSTKAVKGRISGSGNIAFVGEPKETDLKHSGTGKFTLHQ